MPNRPSQTFKGPLQHLIYSPRGEVEGALINAEDAPVQVVIDPHDADAAAAFAGLTAGQALQLRATPQRPSPKGPAAHTVVAFERLLLVDGARPSKRKPRTGPAYQGTVVRLNYARHGAANGVVLDSGDFIHTKPDGMARLRLKVGDKVQADGDAQRLVDDSGWAVEATTVNGKAVKPH